MMEELKVIIKAEINKFKSNVDEAEKQTKSFKEQVEEAGKSVEDNLAKAGEKIRSGLKTAGTALAATGAALLALGASTAEYRNEQAKLQTAFETAGASADTAKGTYNDLFRVIGDSGVATEAAGHLAKLTTNQKDLSEWTTICQGVYATFGDSIPIEGLTEAANETAKTGELTGGLADALNWAGVSEDAFAEKLAACNSEAEREQLIRETLNGLYGEAAANFEKNNAAILAQNEAQAKLNDAMAALGEVTAPIMTMLTELGADILTALTPYIQDFADKYLPTIKDVLSTLGEKLKETLDFMKEHKDVLSAIALVIGSVTAAILVYNAAMAIKDIMDAKNVATVWALVAAYAKQAAAALVANAGIILIVAAIAAVIAIIVLCIKHWDEIAEAAGKAWDWIKGVWEKVANWINEKVVQPIVKFFTNLWTKIEEIFGKVKEWFVEKFQGAWDGIKQVFSVFVDYFKMQWENVKLIFSVVKDVLTGNFSDAWEGIKKIFSNFAGFFSGLWDTIKNTFTNLGTKLGDAIGGAVKAGINKVIGWIESTINKAINLINGALSIINAIPGVNIPKLSRLNLPRLARGGVVDSATIAMIGEQGKEAVVPLENNLGWLDKLAGMLNERMGGGLAPIVLQVDGKTLAEVSVDNINKLTKQTGSLPLVIR